LGILRSPQADPCLKEIDEILIKEASSMKYEQIFHWNRNALATLVANSAHSFSLQIIFADAT
jgi:hypothetical protein